MVTPEQNIQKNINTLMEQAKDYNKSGNFIASLNSLIKAWDILPEPKEQFDDSYHIVKSIIQISLKYDEIPKAREWIKKIYDCDKSRIDSGEREYIHGKIEFVDNNLKEAKSLFKIAFQKSEGRYPKPEEKEFMKLIFE